MTSSLPSDLRDAVRSLAGRPSFSLLLLLTLALGIGATTTIVSAGYALLLRPYPYEAPDRLVRVQSVSPDSFTALRIPLRRGRLIGATDTNTSEPIVVISERAARLFWSNQDPIGQYLCWGKPSGGNPWTRVVGVVGNVKLHAAEGESGIELYYPITQWPVASSVYVLRTLFGVPPHDPATYVVVTLTIGVVCLIACWLPAKAGVARARRHDPAGRLNPRDQHAPRHSSLSERPRFQVTGP